MKHAICSKVGGPGDHTKGNKSGTNTEIQISYGITLAVFSRIKNRKMFFSLSPFRPPVVMVVMLEAWANWIRSEGSFSASLALNPILIQSLESDLTFTWKYVKISYPSLKMKYFPSPPGST